MFFPTLVVLTAVAGAVAQSTVTVETVTAPVQCSNAQVIFSGSNPPFTIEVIPPGQANAGAVAIETLGTFSSSPYVWKVNLATNTVFALRIRDSQANINYSGSSTVQPSSDSSCVGQSTGGVTSTGSVASSAVSSAASSASSAALSSSSAIVSSVSSVSTSVAAASSSSVSKSVASVSSVSTSASHASASTSSSSPSPSPSSGAGFVNTTPNGILASLAGVFGLALFL